MKFSVAVLALINSVDARSAWTTIPGTKDQLIKDKTNKDFDPNNLSVSYYTVLAKRNATATEEQTMLRGTLKLTFADDESIPEDGNAVRICMSMRNPSTDIKVNTWKPTEWESIGFQLTDWAFKSTW